MSDILNSLAVFYVVSQISGLIQWQYQHHTHVLRRSFLLEAYTFVVLVAAVVFFLCSILSGGDTFIIGDDTTGGIKADFIQLIGIRIAHIACLAESLLQRAKLGDFFGKVREIDKIFENCLNVDINHGEIRRKTLRYAGIMFTAYISAELFKLAVVLLATKAQHFPLYWIWYSLPLLVCGSRYFQIYTTVSIIKQRLDVLIANFEVVHLVRLQAAKFAGFAFTKNKSHPVPQRIYNIHAANTSLQRLLIIRDLYNRLWELTALFNDIFGVSILINVTNDFISNTSNCYWVFLNIKDFTPTTDGLLELASNAAWAMPHIFNILMLIVICDSTTSATMRMANSLHRIKIDNENETHNAVIEQFSLQLLHQKLAFTAAGFFNVDCSLLYTIVGATTTYLIILIQFHMSEVNLTAN